MFHFAALISHDNADRIASNVNISKDSKRLETNPSSGTTKDAIFRLFRFHRIFNNILKSNFVSANKLNVIFKKEKNMHPFCLSQQIELKADFMPKQKCR